MLPIEVPVHNFTLMQSSIREKSITIKPLHVKFQMKVSSCVTDVISGKVMVHEWGHLRWGLFDEYWHKGQDTNKASRFYLDNNGNNAVTKCGKRLPGEFYVSCVHLTLSIGYYLS